MKRSSGIIQRFIYRTDSQTGFCTMGEKASQALRFNSGCLCEIYRDKQKCRMAMETGNPSIKWLRWQKGEELRYMTHTEQRLWLIQKLLAERTDAAGVKIPEDEQGQKDLLRGLMNIRMPEAIDDEFLKIQDEYLREENLVDGVVKIEDLTPVKADERIYIWQGDMSRLAVDAVTLPANSGFTGCYQWLHNCLDNILGSKAGIELRLYTNDMITRQGYPEPTGQAKITPGFNLPSKYIIHTVGPIVQGRKPILQ